jgi:peptidoglycan/LPS O-acetylase OafA/YrhL
MSAQTKRPHLATIDVLRLVAALSVVLFHIFFRGAAGDAQLAQGYPEVAGIALYGYLGVNLFFLISGYVIAWSAEGRAWDSFAISRFVRLYPAFLFCMTLTFIILFAAASPLFPVTLNQYLANIVLFAPAFGQPFMDGVYWSIVIELIFYGWLTLALLTGLFERRKLEIVAVWLAVCALNEFFIGSGAMRMLFITEFGPFFVAGILTHHLQTRGRSAEVIGLLVAAFALSCATLTVTQGWMQDHYGIAVPLPGLIIADVIMHVTLFAAIRFSHVLRASGWTLAFGGLTYPLYLLHQNIGYLVVDALAPSTGRWLAAGVTIAALIVVSWAIWRYVENPAQGLLRRAIMPVQARIHSAWAARPGRSPAPAATA